MMPWINQENKAECLKLISDSQADIMCGHLECDGFEVTPGMKFDGGFKVSEFKNFKRVWSGHFHHKSKHGNVQYLGNPYQMFWNDYKDTRGFHIYDTETDKLKFIKNPYEIFDKIFYDDASVDYNKQDVSSYKDKFIKLIVEEKRDYQMFETLVDRLYNVGAHDVKIVETLVDADNIEDAELETKDTMTLLNEYIDEVEIAVDKTELKSLMRTLYIEKLQCCLMFVLTLENHPDGVYSVFDEAEDRVIPIFIEGDDAERYLMMMEIDDDYPPMQVVEMEDHVIIGACQDRGQKFSIITPDDFLIPPDDPEE